MRPKVRENLRTANFNPNYLKKSVKDMEMCARFSGFRPVAISYINHKTD